MLKLTLTDKNQYFYLFIIILIATVLRLYHLNYQSLLGDELYSLIPTSPANSVSSIIEYCKSDQPPLHFLMLHYWFKLVPYNEYMGRLLSVILGLLGVIAMYFLGKEFKDKTTGLMASALTSISYFHIQYSQELRFYSLLFLLTCLSYLYFLKSYKKPTLINYSLYCVFSIGMIYTHYFAPVVIMSQGVIFLVMVFSGNRDRRFIIYSILSGIIILLSYIPWLPTILQDTKIESIWIAKPSPLFFGLYFYMYLGKDPFLALLFVFFTGLFIKQFIQRNKIDQPHQSERFIKDRFLIITLWILIGYLIPYLYSVLVIPVLEARYTIIVLPAWFLVFSIGWSLLKNIKIRTILIGCIVISTALNFVFFNEYYTKIRKEQLRETAQVVLDNYTEPVKIFTSMAFFYNYYFAKANSGISSINPTPWYPAQSPAELNFATELANDKKVWILQGHILQPVTDTQQAYLNEHFNVEKEFTFYYAYAKLYVRK